MDVSGAPKVPLTVGSAKNSRRMMAHGSEGRVGLTSSKRWIRESKRTAEEGCPWYKLLSRRNTLPMRCRRGGADMMERRTQEDGPIRLLRCPALAGPGRCPLRNQV